MSPLYPISHCEQMVAFWHVEQKGLTIEQEEQIVSLKNLVSQTPQLGLIYPTAHVRQLAPV